MLLQPTCSIVPFLAFTSISLSFSDNLQTGFAKEKTMDHEIEHAGPTFKAKILFYQNFIGIGYFCFFSFEAGYLSIQKEFPLVFLDIRSL